MRNEDKKYITNVKHFNFFVSECKRFQRILSLMDWVLHYAHIKGGELLAWCNAEETAGAATIFLNTEWIDNKPTKEELSRFAFHEVCEVLLWKLDEMAGVGCSRNRCNQERHAIIRRLENTVWRLFDKH